jgi:hypothetical protein
MQVTKYHTVLTGMHHGTKEGYKAEVKPKTTWMSHLGKVIL